MQDLKADNRLFAPIRVGNCDLKHRIVMAPLTRDKSTTKGHVPLDFVADYYGQRGSVPGTLLITEATFISGCAGGMDSVPGIWSDDQIEAWKKTTAAVHNNGSFIFLQMWALGRAAEPETLEEDGFPYVSSSAAPLSYRKGGDVPRALSIEGINEYAQLYAQAAENAVLKAGFDGVEVHGANGYLVDQFTQDLVNQRTDSYGGSIENRSRFALEVVQAVINRVGAERTAIRLSPFSTFQRMRMADPIPQFTHLISELAKRHPKMAYLHCVEARIAGSSGVSADPADTLDFARNAWRVTGRPFLVASGFNREKALWHMERSDVENDIMVFGRYFISNPDLPRRIRENIPFTPYNRKTFYIIESREGYTDYPFAQ